MNSFIMIASFIFPIHAYTVGVLGLQGAVSEHMAALRRAHVTPIKVLTVQDMHMIDALIIPGGESTTLKVLLEGTDLGQTLRGFDKPIWGVCA